MRGRMYYSLLSLHPSLTFEKRFANRGESGFVFETNCALGNKQLERVSDQPWCVVIFSPTVSIWMFCMSTWHGNQRTFCPSPHFLESTCPDRHSCETTRIRRTVKVHIPSRSWCHFKTAAEDDLWLSSFLIKSNWRQWTMTTILDELYYQLLDFASTKSPMPLPPNARIMPSFLRLLVKRKKNTITSHFQRLAVY